VNKEASLQLAVTTSQENEELVNKALCISADLKIPYYPRKGLSVALLKEKYSLDSIIIVQKERVIARKNHQELFFHPGLAVCRISELKKGKKDTMIEAMQLKEGDSVLDCTAGIANDALVASFIVGTSGEILALEASKAIYCITKDGLKNYAKRQKNLKEAQSKIILKNEYYDDYLEKAGDNSADIVYFDPMFSKPLLSSSGIKPLRDFACYGSISKNTLENALRVCKKRVVIKTSKDNCRQLSELGDVELFFGKYSKIAFGIFLKQGR
jgi:16S rRNA G966 N2-methylase RsmD